MSLPGRRFLSQLCTLCLLAFAVFGAAQTAPLSPPVAPVKPVTDTYFGTPVVDPYRWMETSTDDLMAYMKAENAVTVQALQPFASQDAQILSELTKLSDTVDIVSNPSRVLDRFFYLELPSGKSDYLLMTRATSGGPSRLLLDPATLAEGGKHAAIDYYVPSPDGQYVAVGVSLGGSENSVLHVVETATGKLLSESISRAQEASPSWTDDSKGFYFARLQPMAQGAAASTKYDNERVYYHRLGAAEETDQPVFGPDITTDPALPKNGNVFVSVVPGTGMIVAGQTSGVVETPALWVRRSLVRPMDSGGETRRRNDGHRAAWKPRLYPDQGRSERSGQQRTRSELRSCQRDVRGSARGAAREQPDSFGENRRRIGLRERRALRSRIS